MIAIGVDWEGCRNVLAVELANRESQRERITPASDVLKTSVVYLFAKPIQDRCVAAATMERDRAHPTREHLRAQSHAADHVALVARTANG